MHSSFKHVEITLCNTTMLQRFLNNYYLIFPAHMPRASSKWGHCPHRISHAVKSWFMTHNDAGISGWIAAKSDFLTMWAPVPLPDTERYTLVWESKVQQHIACDKESKQHPALPAVCSRSAETQTHQLTMGGNYNRNH